MTIRIPKWAAAALGLFLFAGFATGLALLTTGGSDKKPKASKSANVGSTSTAGQTTSTATLEGLGDCDELGINPQVRNEGTCQADGEAFTVVNRDSLLRLPDLTARLESVDYEDAVAGGGAGFGKATANGTFVIIRLSVKNLTNAPVSFDDDQQQTYLILGQRGTQFSENFNAENGPVPDSFLWEGTSQGDIQPGETRSGAIVFDIPNQYVDTVERGGVNGADLAISTFKQEAAYKDLPALPLGEIRLYSSSSPAGSSTTQ